MYFYFSCLLIFLSCRNDAGSIEATSGQALVSYAKGFKIFEFDTNFVVAVGDARFSFSKKNKNQTYVLSSITQLQFLRALGEEVGIVGLFDAKFFSDISIINRLNNGEIENFKQANSPDWELMVKHSKSVVLGYRSFSLDKAMIENLHLKVLPINEFDENHPLGKAEWIKVFGVISGKYQSADSIFKKIEERYLAAKPANNDSTRRFKVIAGECYDGVWTVPGSNSYVASLVNDAGGEYVIKDDETPVIMMNKEAFSSKMKYADFWRKVSTDSLPMQKISVAELKSKYQISPDRLKSIIFCDASKVHYFDAVLLNPDKELKDFVNALKGVDSMNYYRLIKVERN